MTYKSAATWIQTKLWCVAHPNKTALIITPQGRFEITYAPNPKPEELKGIAHD